MEGDINRGMIRDSEIKFWLRILTHEVQKLPDRYSKPLLKPIYEIAQLENKRLDELEEKAE